jgi:hypothetical protein
MHSPIICFVEQAFQPGCVPVTKGNIDNPANITQYR